MKLYALFAEDPENDTLTGGTSLFRKCVGETNAQPAGSVGPPRYALGATELMQAGRSRKAAWRIFLWRQK